MSIQIEIRILKRNYSYSQGEISHYTIFLRFICFRPKMYMVKRRTFKAEDPP